MERVPVESEMIRSVGYRDGVLEVEFEKGSVYQYFDVPAPLHDELMQADSKGTFFNDQIRGAFRYART